MDTLLPSDLTDPCVYLSHREKSCNVQKVSQLFISLDQLHELISEDPEKHAMKISSLLLWIAAKHPYVLENESWGKALPAEILKVLYFKSSWEHPREAIPTEAMITILKSTFCRRGLKAFCGYISPKALSWIPGYQNMRGAYQCSIRLTLGSDINVVSLIEELHRQHQQSRKDCWYASEDFEYKFENLSVQLRCGELQGKDLTHLPDTEPKLFISEVNDDDADWVVQVVAALQPKEDICHPRAECSKDFGGLYFPHSNLTSSGVESIVRGLFEAGITYPIFAVSSPSIPFSILDGESDCKCSFDCGCGNWSHGFATWVMDKFDIHFVYFTDEEGLNFTHFTFFDIHGDESLDGDERFW